MLVCRDHERRRWQVDDDELTRDGRAKPIGVEKVEEQGVSKFPSVGVGGAGSADQGGPCRRPWYGHDGLMSRRGGRCWAWIQRSVRLSTVWSRQLESWGSDRQLQVGHASWAKTAKTRAEGRVDAVREQMSGPAPKQSPPCTYLVVATKHGVPRLRPNRRASMGSLEDAPGGWRSSTWLSGEAFGPLGVG